jgi:hypothetical protein
LLIVSFSHAQQDQDNEPCHSIGKVLTRGDLIIMELEDSALGKANLFDLTGHTLRFMPDGSGYHVGSGPLNWDSDASAEGSGFSMSRSPISWLSTVAMLTC